MDVRPIDANAMVKWLYKQTEGAIAMEDHVPEQFKEYYRGKMETFIEVSCIVRRHMLTLELAPCQQWISVKERLPPDQKKILVVNGHGYVTILAFVKELDGKWTWLTESGKYNHINDITHWMPLPEQPKEEK